MKNYFKKEIYIMKKYLILVSMLLSACDNTTGSISASVKFPTPKPSQIKKALKYNNSNTDDSGYLFIEIK
jgi:hypothetical protein